MNILLKYAGMIAVAFSLVGCGDDCGKEKKCADKDRVEYSAKVAADTQLVVFINNIDNPAFAPVFEVYKKALANDIAKGESKAKEFKAFLKEAGLDNSKMNWCVASIGKLDLSNIQRLHNVSNISVVFNIKHDGGKLFAAVSNKTNNLDNIKFEEIEVSGVKSLKCPTPITDRISATYFTSINDQLMVFAGSEEILKTQIALYRDNADASTKFDDLLNDKNLILGGAVADVGTILAKAEKSESRDMTKESALLNQINYKEFKTLDFGLKADKSGAVTVFSNLETRDTKDAEVLAAMLKMIHMTAIAQFTQFRETANYSDARSDINLLLEVLNTVDIKAEGAKAAVKIPVPQKAMDFCVEELERKLLGK